jgi:protein transport protein SEC24
VPLAVLCTPLAVHASDFVPRPRVVPSGGDVDCGDTCEFRTEEWRDPQSIPLVPEAEDGVGPARCSHCSAYVNPFFGLDGKCNFCGSTTRNLDLSGIPMQFGTCEYEVSGPYITRSLPVLPVHVYALDLTCPNLEKYLPILEKLGTDMAQHFWRQGGGYGMTSNGNDDRNTPMEETKPRMGICFVASAGIFIRQPGPGNCPEGQPYVVMSDVTEDPFCPLPLQDWTFDLSTQEGLESWQIFVRDELVVDIATLRKQARETNVYGRDGLELSCGGAALAFLADALSFTGGRGTLISWRRPNFGMGDVKYREEKVMVGATKNRYSVSTPLQLQQEFLRDTSPDQAATAAFYTNLAADCSKNRISLNIMMHTSSDAATTSFLDMATLGEVCRATCGKLMWVSAQNWQEAFYEELTQQLQSFSGHDAVFKLRCSEGIQVKSYVSNCGTVVDGGLAGSPELDLVSLSPSSCVSVELDHRVGGIPKRSGRVFLQSALLYSTSGRRRVRVSTLAIRTTSIVNEVFRSIDFGATTAFLLRDCVARLHKSQSSEEDREALVTKTRDELYYRCVHILVNYRLHTPAKNSPSGQLILPDKLQLLPLFCMCIVKSPMLRRSMPRRNDGSQAVRLSPSGDERSFYSWHAEQANPVTAMLLAHPAVFSVSNLEEGDGKWNPGAEGISGFVRMPPPLLASMECLEDDGCYIVDSGLALYLVIGKDVSVDLRENSIQSTTNEAALDPAIKRVVWQIRTFASTERGSESELRPTFAPIVLVVQKENHQAPHETDVLNLMIDDAVGREKDYSDFLISLHQRIRQRVDTK